MAGIVPVQYHHSRILLQAPIELTIAHIDGIHPMSAPLQKTVGKSTGGGPDIHGNHAAGIDPEGIQRGFELFSPPADIRLLLQKPDAGLVRDEPGRFVCKGIIHSDTTRQDQPPGLLPTIGQSTKNKGSVQSVTRRLCRHGGTKL